MTLSRMWHVVRTDPGRIARADREVMAATLRREAGLALAPVTRLGRRMVVGTLSGLADRGGPAATYARVLDGHTLNLLVETPGTEIASAVVVLARRRVRERLPATLRPGAAEATASLRGLAPGRWRVLLEATYADGRAETLTVRHAEPGRGDGPTLAAPPCRDTGYRYQVGCTPAGTLTMTVVPPEPAAELTGLRTHATGLRLTGRFLGVADPSGAEIVFAGPDRREYRVPAPVRDLTFEVAVPVAALADDPAERAWRVWADVPAAGRLRVGRFLTGLASPQDVYRRPNRMIRLDGRAFAMVRASYAAGGGLTLVCAGGEAVR